MVSSIAGEKYQQSWPTRLIRPNTEEHKIGLPGIDLFVRVPSLIELMLDWVQCVNCYIRERPFHQLGEKAGPKCVAKLPIPLQQCAVPCMVSSRGMLLQGGLQVHHLLRFESHNRHTNVSNIFAGVAQLQWSVKVVS